MTAVEQRRRPGLLLVVLIAEPLVERPAQPAVAAFVSVWQPVGSFSCLASKSATFEQASGMLRCTWVLPAESSLEHPSTSSPHFHTVVSVADSAEGVERLVRAG